MKRKWSQFISTIIHNGNIGFLATHSIYRGFFKNFCAPGLNCHSCPASLFACPLGILQNFLSSLRILPLNTLLIIFFYLLSFFLFFGLSLGRFICGWLCPFGFFQELLYKIPFIKTQLYFPFKIQRYFKFIFLFLFVIFLPIFVSQNLGYGSLWFCKYICPAGTFEAGYFNLLLQPSLLTLIGSIFYLKTLILILVIIFCLMDFRFFCKNICPLGVIYGFFNKFSLIKLSFDKKLCSQCKNCEKVCPVNLSLPVDLNSIECIRCLNCVNVCPTKAIRIQIDNPFKLF